LLRQGSASARVQVTWLYLISPITRFVVIQGFTMMYALDYEHGVLSLKLNIEPQSNTKNTARPVGRCLSTCFVFTPPLLVYVLHTL